MSNATYREINRMLARAAKRQEIVDDLQAFFDRARTADEELVAALAVATGPIIAERDHAANEQINALASLAAEQEARAAREMDERTEARRQPVTPRRVTYTGVTRRVTRSMAREGKRG